MLVCIFSIYCQTVLLSAYTSLYFRQNCVNLLVVLLPLQHFILFISFFFSHFVGCLVILNCGFNLYFSGNSEVQHLFRFLLAICILPLWSAYSKSCSFSIGLASFFLLFWRISLYIMGISISIYILVYVCVIYIYYKHILYGLLFSF